MIKSADISIQSDTTQQERDAFFHSCIVGNIEEVMEMLWYGFDPNVTDARGKTPLIVASQYGQVEIVKLLLAHHADVTVRSKVGWTALQYSVYNLRPEITHLLRKHGAKE